MRRAALHWGVRRRQEAISQVVAALHVRDSKFPNELSVRLFDAVQKGIVFSLADSVDDQHLPCPSRWEFEISEVLCQISRRIESIDGHT